MRCIDVEISMIKWHPIEVVPKWNVNIAEEEVEMNQRKIEVVPKWNVNEDFPDSKYGIASIEVVPKWNVNLEKNLNQ